MLMIMKTDAERQIWPKMFIMVVKNPLGSKNTEFLQHLYCKTFKYYSPYPKAWIVVMIFVTRKKLSMPQSQISKEWNALVKLGLFKIIMVKKFPRHPKLMKMAPDTPEIQYFHLIISWKKADEEKIFFTIFDRDRASLSQFYKWLCGAILLLVVLWTARWCCLYSLLSTVFIAELCFHCWDCLYFGAE